jgi:flagellar assembly factor FliW
VNGSLAIDRAAHKGVAVGNEVPEIELVRPLPGFPDLTRYVLIRPGGEVDDPDAAAQADAVDAVDAEADPEPDDVDPVLYELRSVEQPQVRFLVAVPTAFFPDYAFDLDEVSCAELGLDDAEHAVVLVLLTIGDDAASTTANLLAPVVINARTRTATQVILSGTDWPVRAAVV